MEKKRSKSILQNKGSFTHKVDVKKDRAKIVKTEGSDLRATKKSK